MLSRAIRGWMLLVFSWMFIATAVRHASLPLLYVSAALAVFAAVIFVSDFLGVK